MRGYFFCLMGLVAHGLALSASAAEPARPNIVFILADDTY